MRRWVVVGLLRDGTWCEWSRHWTLAGARRRYHYLRRHRHTSPMGLRPQAFSYLSAEAWDARTQRATFEME